MDSNVIWVLLVGLVAFGALLGLLVRATQTRVRNATPTAERILPEAFTVDGVEPTFGARLTFVQFSTEFCARCPSTARILRKAAGATPGVAHIEVDVTRRDDLIERFSILRTPTVLVLGVDGQLLTRLSGPVSAAWATASIDTNLTDAPDLAHAPDLTDAPELERNRT